MKFWVGVTDNEWFDFLSKRAPDEVNFWQPGGGTFRALEPGGLFLFKLHSPLNYIVGGGYFVRQSLIPTSLAWKAFEEKNGTASSEDLLSKITNYRSSKTRDPDPMIGCIILAEPFFFSRDDWLPIPEDWKSNIVKGKKYDRRKPTGAKLWDQVKERLVKYKPFSERSENIAAEEEAVYGSEYLTRARLGQGTFRILVLESYNRRCAITGERTIPVLESAHIKPYARSGPNKVNNGLLLRSDLHKLFDSGLMTVTKDCHVEVSKRIKELYENGREYYALHGNKLTSMPDNISERPSPNLIDWHNQNIYVP